MASLLDGRFVEGLKVLERAGLSLEILGRLKNPEKDENILRAAQEAVRVLVARLNGEEDQKTTILPAPAFSYAKTKIDVSFFLDDWQRYYFDRWDKREDFSKITLPPTRPDFAWGVILPEWLKFEGAFNHLNKFCDSWKVWPGSLDDAIPDNVRSPQNGSYAIWCRATSEAVEYPNTSAQKIRDGKIDSMTSLERFILGDWFHWKTGSHLDQQTLTICAGSTDRNGFVPYIRRYPDDHRRVQVGNVVPADACDTWSVRGVVSLAAASAAV